MQESTHPLFNLSQEDIVDNCGKVFTTRALSYLRTDKVLEVNWNPRDQTLTGKVAGESALPYSQTVKAEKNFIDGACSCPVGYNCKHVAALLLQWIETNAETHSGLATDTNIDVVHETAQVEQWHDKLLRHSNTAEVDEDNKIYPGEEMLLFELKPGNQYNSQQGINVDIIKTRLLRQGGYGKESIYRYQSDYHFPRWMTSLDKDIINIALACRDRFNYKPLSIEGDLGTALLQKLIQSGRAYWKSDRESPIKAAPPRKLKLEWQSTVENTKYTLTSRLQEASGDWYLVPCSEPWYLDTGAVLSGPVSTGVSGSLLHDLLHAPDLSREQAQETANFLTLNLPDEQIPLPVPAEFQTLAVKPVPVLLMRSLQTGTEINNYYVSIHFLYDVYQLPFEGNDSALNEKTSPEGNTIIIRRDLATELNHLVFFNQQCPGFAPADNWDASQFTSADRMPRPDLDRRVAAEWRSFFDKIEVFKDSGWLIQHHESFDLNFTDARDISAKVHDDQGGWFDVALTLTSSGQSFELLPLVRDWLEMDSPDKSLMLSTDDGQWIEVAPEVLEPVVNVLLELFNTSPDKHLLRLPRQRAALINALDSEFDEQGITIRWDGDVTLRKLSDNLVAAHELRPFDPPENLIAELRDYQALGLAWLQFLQPLGFNGLLADDMGLGKTMQALSHLLVEFNEGRLAQPALVITPTSVLGNWRNEIERFVPVLRPLVLHGSDRHDHFAKISEHQIVITSYQILLRDIELFHEQTFSHIILDEAQMIKNPMAKVTQALKTLTIKNRLCLTGTPMENHLGELWSLFDFLMPGFLGTRKEFTLNYRTPIEKHNNKEKQARLNKMISVFMLRRNKDQVASELPPKTVIVREVELGESQTTLYESIRLSMEQRVQELIRLKGANRSHIEILDALLKLRQTCCHPKLVKLESASVVTESAKLDYLLNMVEELVAEDKKILLFSQFTQMLALIEVALKEANITYIKLTGATRKRDVVIDQFQNGNIPVFLISLKAGGTGLNLTAADTVIHYDPWWNPAVENQASDRAHRIGQDKPVFVYKLVAKNTVEEKILQMQEKKQELADNTYNRKESADPLKKMTTEDILELLTSK